MLTPVPLFWSETEWPMAVQIWVALALVFFTFIRSPRSSESGGGNSATISKGGADICVLLERLGPRPSIATRQQSQLLPRCRDLDLIERSVQGVGTLFRSIEDRL
jgi:hypothetical protein